jgi:hypothetical protein
LGFLETLKSNQPPYLDALYLLGKAIPQGSRVESLSMNRRGEVALRGSMRNSSEVTDFRSKLIASGFFSSVTVEEQSPTPDRQKVNVRISATWKPGRERALLAIGPTAEEIEKSKNKVRDTPGGMPPGMDFPGGMPMAFPGMPMGGPMPGAVKRPPRSSTGPTMTLPPGVSIPNGPGGPVIVTPQKGGATSTPPPNFPMPVESNP